MDISKNSKKIRTFNLDTYPIEKNVRNWISTTKKQSRGTGEERDREGFGERMGSDDKS